MPKLDKRANALIIEWCDAILMATRELTRVLGVTARRGLQFQGSPDSPDVVTEIEGIHIECKRTETLSLYSALEQAQNDAGTSKIPVVCHRKNKKPWVVVLRLDDLKSLVSILHENINRNHETDPAEYRSPPDSY